MQDILRMSSIVSPEEIQEGSPEMRLMGGFLGLEAE